jgi:hypothetical protein
MLTNNEISGFLEEEIHQMEIHKWIESEKACMDLGEAALHDWIIKYAVNFRKEWNEKHGKRSTSCSGIAA